MLDRAVRAVVLPLARAYGRLVRCFSPAGVFVPTARIDWIARLESNWEVIRDELEHLRSGFELPALLDLIPDEQYVTDARWKMFVFRYYGRTISENCVLCPRTAALLERVPGLVSANFSVLQPDARIAPHRALFAGVLRYHLGLVVPAGDRCAIRVGGHTRHWREGASLLFDDTNQHEAWNLTDRDRVVLLLDVKRDLPAPLGWVNDALLALLSRLVMRDLATAERMVPNAARPAAS